MAIGRLVRCGSMKARDVRGRPEAAGGPAVSRGAAPGTTQPVRTAERDQEGAAPPPQPTPVVVVREMSTADLAFAVAGHVEQLPGGFFVRLGPGFLRAYYRGFAEGPHGVALVADVDGAPLGALVGTTCQTAHYRWLLRRRGPRLALRGGAALIVRPSELRTFLRGRLGRYARAVPRMVRGRVRRDPPAAEESRDTVPVVDLVAAETDTSGAVPDGSVAVLHHVFVTPQAASNGVGSQLVRRFEAVAAEAGAVEARLVTVADVGRSAAGFYERLGWASCDQRRDRDGRAVIELRKSFR
jgi:GNAT superfamily N-acetyltransferase